MLKIIHHPADILKERMPEFDFLNPSEDPVQLEKDMIETMFASGGTGLSANQVGKRVRMFVMEIRKIQNLPKGSLIHILSPLQNGFLKWMKDA